jgi:uncharacterized membrane protein
MKDPEIIGIMVARVIAGKTQRISGSRAVSPFRTPYANGDSHCDLQQRKSHKHLVLFSLFLLLFIFLFNLFFICFNQLEQSLAMKRKG